MNGTWSALGAAALLAAVGVTRGVRGSSSDLGDGVPRDADADYDPANPTASLAFRRWFGKSRVVDDHHQPRVVYHGSYGHHAKPQQGITSFDRVHSRGMDRLGAGAWFDTDVAVPNVMAGNATLPRYTDAPAQVVPAYLRVERPKVYESTPLSALTIFGQKVLQDVDHALRNRDNPAAHDAAHDLYRQLEGEHGYVDAWTRMVWDLFPRWAIRPPWGIVRLQTKSGSEKWRLTFRGESHGESPLVGAARSRWARETVQREAAGRNANLTVANALSSDIPTNAEVDRVRFRLQNGPGDGRLYDGIQLRNTLADLTFRDHAVDDAGNVGSDWWIPFEPGQIKSATGNRGTFDLDDPRISLNRSWERK